jgi:predicted nucleic acid-binding protein
MSVDHFIDTNVLVYAVSGAPAEARKRARANEILAEGRFGISGQVLQEFFVTVTRRTKSGASPREALAWVEKFAHVPCVPTDFDLVRTAIGHSLRYQISYWDGAIIAAAQELGAATLFTEDLNDGQTFGPVSIVNPFRDL